MGIFVKDLKLNLSPYYLKPGFAFGGSCLPKEVRAVAHLAVEKGVSVPLIDSLAVSNDRHIQEAVRLLSPFKGKRIGFLGVTFKSNTDDLRESPTLELMARLLAAGETVKAYDPNLRFGPHLQGQIDYVRHACPTQAALMDELEAMALASAEELVAGSDVVVVSHATDEFRKAVAGRGAEVHVLDLVRLFPRRPSEPTYEGIAW
jgi:GDP-mannose 6-dehydrogenase